MGSEIKFGRRFVLAGLLASVATPALAGPPRRSIRPAPRPTYVRKIATENVGETVEKAGLSGKVGFMVVDLDSGKTLESRTPLLPLPPASVTKAITSIYALNTLGGEHRFRTRLLATGPIKNGQIEGDLILAGDGDPTLDTDALAVLAKRLKDAGVIGITGKARIYAAALPYQKSIDPGQPDHLGYNPSLSGLNLNFNRVFFEWKREANGYDVKMEARALKFRPRVTMSKMRVVERKSPVYTHKSTINSEEWTVSRRALGKKGGRWLPVRRPEYYAGEVFHTIARSYGIELPSFGVVKTLPRSTVIAEWQSEQLSSMLRGMMKFSTNLIAEASGVSASLARGRKPGNLKSSGREMAAWLKATHGARHTKFRDHSGLGEDSRMSAADMAKVLSKQGWNGPLRALMKDIPLRDENGRPIKNAPIKVWAKTGTLNFVSSLAGYIETPKGGRLAFAIFAADLPKRSKISKSQRERPPGARTWNKQAKVLQQQLIERWAALAG